MAQHVKMIKTLICFHTTRHYSIIVQNPYLTRIHTLICVLNCINVNMIKPLICFHTTHHYFIIVHTPYLTRIHSLICANIHL